MEYEPLAEIGNDKIKINGHGKLIKMDDFLKFITVEVHRSSDHLGYSNGWTKLKGDNNLIISGGIINGIEYLDSIQYKKNLHNKYNDYVNPFYLNEIMTEEGRNFFITYFRDDINKIIDKNKSEIVFAENRLNQLKEKQKFTKDFWESLNYVIKDDK